MTGKDSSIKGITIFALLGGVLLLAACPALAFHNNGVANCDGCHVMHGSLDGQSLPLGTQPLLLAPTATDVCLMCHGGQDGVFGHNPMDPPRELGAGNFVFLLEENINDGADGLSNPIHGEAAGHSVISMENGVGPDSRWTYSPGGNFPSDQLGCTSCHDPHGNRNFRMLNGVGPIQGGGFEFTYPAPVASGLDISDPLARESLDLHTAYNQGMSDWCGNCHGLYHEQSSGSTFEHGSDERLRNGHMQTYNRYNGTSDPHGGFPGTAYLPDVPFESAKCTISSTEGPTTLSIVMCLTCHRAHASSGPSAGRWDFNVGLLDEDGLISGSWQIPNPYDDSTQVQLCAKCHPFANH